MDLWIEDKLNQTIFQVEVALALYRFDRLAIVLYDFTWNEFCAWYLELTKPVLKNGTDTKSGNQAHLVGCAGTFAALDASSDALHYRGFMA